MNAKIVIDYNKCTGCRACEMVCSLNKWGECNSERSCIRNIRTEEGGINTTIPVVCQQCENPFCEAVCPVEAISRDPITSALIVNRDKCIGCRLCVYSCPFGGANVDVERGYMNKCDLCGGDPNCVKMCSKEAISYIPVEKIGTNLKRKGIGKYQEFVRSTIK